MKMKVLIAIIAGSLVAFYGFLLIPGERDSLEALVTNIRVGMSEADVIKFVGVPPGHYATDKDATAPRVGYYVFSSDVLTITSYSRGWLFDEGALLVSFNNGHVSESPLKGSVSSKQSRLIPPTFNVRNRIWWKFCR